jgi:hypothetical protein
MGDWREEGSKATPTPPPTPPTEGVVHIFWTLHFRRAGPSRIIAYHIFLAPHTMAYVFWPCDLAELAKLLSESSIHKFALLNVLIAALKLSVERWKASIDNMEIKCWKLSIERSMANFTHED